MSCIYKVFAFISFLVRSYVMPNPFDCLQGRTIEINGVELPVIPEVINILIEPILGGITYFVVGFYYSRSSGKPVIGSILYLIFYCIHAALLFVIFHFNFSALSISLVIVFCVFLHILIAVITSKLRKCLYDFSY